MEQKARWGFAQRLAKLSIVHHSSIDASLKRVA